MNTIDAKATGLGVGVPWVVRCLVVVLALGLTGCGDDPELTRLAPGATVLAFGDSLTFGTGAQPEEAYPAVLARRTGLEVVNAGVPGERSAEGLVRLAGVLEEVSPRLVVLIHGGNDFLRRKKSTGTEENLRRMVDAIRTSGAEVVLVGVPNFGLMLSTHELYERVADDLAIPIDADIIPDLLADNDFKSDQVHPNAAGYARMAEAVEALLRESGAL